MKAILLSDARKWLEENVEDIYMRVALLGIVQNMPMVDYREIQNEPLTIEQLREINEEPVWVQNLEEPEKVSGVCCIGTEENILSCKEYRFAAICWKSTGRLGLFTATLRRKMRC